MAQRSIVRSRLSAWSFFMRLLPFQVGMGNQRAGLTQSKAPLPEQTLALTHPQVDLEALLDPGAQRLPIPQRAGQAPVARRLTHGPVHLLQLRLAQTPGAPRAWPLGQLRPDLGPQSAGSSSLPCAGRPRTSGSLLDTSLPAPPTARHGVGDHSEILPNDESHLAVPKSWFRRQQSAVVSSLHETTNLYNAQLLMTLCLVAETLDLIERYVLFHVPVDRPLQDMAETLRDWLHLSPVLNYA